MRSETLARLHERFAQAFPKSARLSDGAKKLFPDGVTHDSRCLEPFPVYVERAAGALKWAVDGQEIIDYWSGHGAFLLGHSQPAVVEAVTRQMARGTHPGACHELEIEWARLVQRLMPAAEKLRFVASGTEATLMALRLARIHTGKPKLLKFAGHYHGWHDYLMAGDDATRAAEAVPGVPMPVAEQIVIVPPNDLAAVEEALARDPQIGCVILEPTGGHFGVVPIGGEFLKTLRELTLRRGVLLIFDEVVTGFRVHPGGAQGHYGVAPDLTALAKVLAGGLPGGCVAGRAEIMAHLEVRPGRLKMKHPGTFNANPLSAAAGIATLEVVAQGGATQQANEAGRLLRQKLNRLFSARGVNWVCYGAFSRWNVLAGYEGPRPTSDDFVPYGGDPARLEAGMPRALMHAFRCAMLLSGVDPMGPRGLTMAAHTPALVERTAAAMAGALDLLEL